MENLVVDGAYRVMGDSNECGTGRTYPTGNEYTAGERTGWCNFGNPEHHAGP